VKHLTGGSTSFFSISHSSPSSLSLPLCSFAWLTPPLWLLSPSTLHNSFSPRLYFPAVLDHLPLISSPLVSLYFSPLNNILPPPVCPSLSLSLSAAFQQAIFVLFTHCGKTTHYGKLGVWPCGEGCCSVIKVTLSAERQRQGRKRLERWVQECSCEYISCYQTLPVEIYYPQLTETIHFCTLKSLIRCSHYL